MTGYKSIIRIVRSEFIRDNKQGHTINYIVTGKMEALYPYAFPTFTLVGKGNICRCASSKPNP